MMIVLRLLMRAALGFRLFREKWMETAAQGEYMHALSVMYLNENMHCIGELARHTQTHMQKPCFCFFLCCLLRALFISPTLGSSGS